MNTEGAQHKPRVAVPIDGAGIVSAARGIANGPPHVVNGVLTSGDPRVAAQLRRILARAGRAEPRTP